jgi:hypothetical protein
MATAVITLKDNEADGDIDVIVEFDPPFPTEGEDIPLAQVYAMHMVQAVSPDLNTLEVER